MQAFSQLRREILGNAFRNTQWLVPRHHIPWFVARQQIFRRLLHNHVPDFRTKQPSCPRKTRPYSTQTSIASTDSQPKSTRKPWRPAPHRNPDEPVYEMYFTCNVCHERSGHTVSKQGYHHGTVLVQCPSCRNRHLISDHLKIFSDTAITLEDIMKEQGQLVQRGTIDEEGDVEFWDGKAAEAAEADATSSKD